MIAQTVNPAAGRAIVSAMADFIRAHAGAHGNVTREDLLLEFTSEEIDAHSEAAKAQARRAGKVRH